MVSVGRLRGYTPVAFRNGTRKWLPGTVQGGTGQRAGGISQEGRTGTAST